MTYEQVKNQVLKLLNQYTIAGSAVTDVYNNQQDYIRRMPGLINDALTEICTTVRKIEAQLALTPELAEDETEREYRFHMPADFYQFKSGAHFIQWRGQQVRNWAYDYRGQDAIVLPKELVEHGEPVLVYYRYPNLLDEDDENIAPSTALDSTADVHRVIPYYVAGTLALHDDPFLASTLLNAYEDKLAKLQRDVATTTLPTTDVYDFYSHPGLY